MLKFLPVAIHDSGWPLLRWEISFCVWWRVTCCSFRSIRVIIRQYKESFMTSLPQGLLGSTHRDYPGLALAGREWQHDCQAFDALRSGSQLLGQKRVHRRANGDFMMRLVHFDLHYMSRVMTTSSRKPEATSKGRYIWQGNVNFW